MRWTQHENEQITKFNLIFRVNQEISIKYK